MLKMPQGSASARLGRTMIYKNSEIEQAIPEEWKESIRQIVNDLRDRKLGFRQIDIGHYLISPDTANDIYRNIKDYGETVISLEESAWETSVCRWIDSHWYILVDLFTVEAGSSDLVLVLNAYEAGISYRFDVLSVHVP
jgi:hypothetical protein